MGGITGQRGSRSCDGGGLPSDDRGEPVGSRGSAPSRALHVAQESSVYCHKGALLELETCWERLAVNATTIPNRWRSRYRPAFMGRGAVLGVQALDLGDYAWPCSLFKRGWRNLTRTLALVTNPATAAPTGLFPSGGKTPPPAYLTCARSAQGHERVQGRTGRRVDDES